VVGREEWVGRRERAGPGLPGGVDVEDLVEEHAVARAERERLLVAGERGGELAPLLAHVAQLFEDARAVVAGAGERAVEGVLGGGRVAAGARQPGGAPPHL